MYRIDSMPTSFHDNQVDVHVVFYVIQCVHFVAELEYYI